MNFKNVLLTCLFFGILQAAERDDSLPSLLPPFYNCLHNIRVGRQIYLTQICEAGDESIDYRFLLGEWYSGEDGILFGFDSSKDLTRDEERENLEDVELLDEERKDYQKPSKDGRKSRKRAGPVPEPHNYPTYGHYEEDLRERNLFLKRQNMSKKKHEHGKKILINKLIQNGVIPNQGISERTVMRDYLMKDLESLLLLGKEPLRSDFENDENYLAAHAQWSSSREEVQKMVEERSEKRKEESKAKRKEKRAKDEE